MEVVCLIACNYPISLAVPAKQNKDASFVSMTKNRCHSDSSQNKKNASGFCYALWPLLQTPEGFTRPPAGFQKPSSVLRGLCGMGNLEVFSIWRDGKP